MLFIRNMHYGEGEGEKSRHAGEIVNRKPAVRKPGTDAFTCRHHSSGISPSFSRQSFAYMYGYLTPSVTSLSGFWNGQNPFAYVDGGSVRIEHSAALSCPKQAPPSVQTNCFMMFSSDFLNSADTSAFSLLTICWIFSLREVLLLFGKI